jgi:hypothetical protein
LLLQGLRHLRVSVRKGPVLLLQFGEQADILDGDHGLIGEGLEERDLVVGESAGLATRHPDGTERLVLPEQR